MSSQKQRDLILASGLEPTGPKYGVVLTKEECAWTMSSQDFLTMSITPSIDASASGHWHGYITNGNIV